MERTNLCNKSAPTWLTDAGDGCSQGQAQEEAVKQVNKLIGLA